MPLHNCTHEIYEYIAIRLVTRNLIDLFIIRVFFVCLFVWPRMYLVNNRRLAENTPTKLKVSRQKRVSENLPFNMGFDDEAKNNF